MTNRPRAIGTRAESLVTRWLRANGFPDARRQTLTGSADQGDILVCVRPTVILEVKSGMAAETASRARIGAWLAQTATERVNARADVAALVQHRRGRNVTDWMVWLPSADWVRLLTGDPLTTTDAPWPVGVSLSDWAAVAAGSDLLAHRPGRAER